MPSHGEKVVCIFMLISQMPLMPEQREAEKSRIPTWTWRLEGKGKATVTQPLHLQVNTKQSDVNWYFHHLANLSDYMF